MDHHSPLPSLPSTTTRDRAQSTKSIDNNNNNNNNTNNNDNSNNKNVALAQLAEFDDLFSRVGDNIMIREILKKDSNLENVLAETEKNQDKTFESFIDQHIQQIPLLCEMFDEVTRCESKLLEFESSIATFQERLTSTAEGIAEMQSETVKLRTKVHNREEVSDRLKQVYEALHETERFCEAISNASSVDEQFLMSIRQLESKIAFLADNDELEGSAIENDMRPKLEHTAHRAGGKIHEFLIRKLSSLTAENANISLHQQAIERQGQYAYSFLVKYNETIALEVSNYYTNIMTEVYRRNLRNTCREYADIVDKAMRIKPFEPYAAIENVVALKGGPKNQENILSQTGFVDPRTLPIVNRPSPPNPFRENGDSSSSNNNSPSSGKREESVSERFKNFFSSNKDNNNNSNSSTTNTHGGVNLGNKRPAVFADFAFVLQGVDTSVGSRTMSFDPLIAQMLSKSFCWVHSLTNMIVKLVNSVVSEGRFLDHFFFLATTATDREEAMLSTLFDGPLRQMQELVQLHITVSNDPVALLTAHRVVELAKNFVTQSCSPIPIMLLTIPLETLFSCIGNRLTELVDVQCENIRSLTSCAPFDKFSSSSNNNIANAKAGTSSSSSNLTDNTTTNNNNNNSYDTSMKRFVNQVQSDRSLASKLGPNEIVRRFAALAGQVICINSLKIDGSRVSNTSLEDCDRVIYDDKTSDKMLAQASMMASIIDQFASSHDTDLARMICKVNSFAHIYFVWKNMEPEPAPTSKQQHQDQKGGSGGVVDSSSSNSGKQQQQSSVNNNNNQQQQSNNRQSSKQRNHQHHSDDTNQNFSAHQFTDEEREQVANTSSYTILTSECRLIEEVLKMNVTEFIKLDAASVEIFNPMIELLKKCQKLIPENVNNNNNSDSISSSTSASSSSLLPTDQELLNSVLIPFHKGWLDALTAVVQRLRVYFNHDGHGGAFKLVLKEYFYFLVDKVKKLHLLVTKYYPKSASVKSKIVGPSTFWTEITRLMS